MKDIFAVIKEGIYKIADTLFFKKYRIYMYAITLNGYIIPPEENRRKTTYVPESLLSFEIAFDKPPYFRTLSATVEEVNEKYKKDFFDFLPSEASYYCSINDAFTYYIELPLGQVSIIDYVREDRFKVIKLIREGKVQELVKVNTKPTFVVKDVRIEQVGSFYVSERILKEFVAVDTAYVRIYRPLRYEIEYEEEPYFEIAFEYEHKL